MNILTMDFGGSSVKYAIVNEEGRLSESGKKAAPLESKEQFVQTVGEIYQYFNQRVDGASISIPGYVDTQAGTLLGSGAYRSLYGCCIRELLKEVVPVNIAIENDGKCGALAEVWKGALKECRDGIVMILGSGIAGGVIKDKKIHSGASQVAGEFSNYLVKPNDPTFCGLAVMNCASFGLTYKLCKIKNLAFDCQDCSAELENVDVNFGNRYPVQAGSKREVKADGRQFAKWLEEGDSEAIEVYEDFLKSLANMIFNIQIIYAPEKVVIGGGLSRISGLIDDLKKHLEAIYQSTGMGTELQAKVARSSYLDECNLVGAAYHYMLCFPKE